jgi:hypothetical protein
MSLVLSSNTNGISIYKYDFSIHLILNTKSKIKSNEWDIKQAVILSLTSMSDIIFDSISLIQNNETSIKLICKSLNSIKLLRDKIKLCKNFIKIGLDELFISVSVNNYNLLDSSDLISNSIVMKNIPNRWLNSTSVITKENWLWKELDLKLGEDAINSMEFVSLDQDSLECNCFIRFNNFNFMSLFLNLFGDNNCLFKKEGARLNVLVDIEVDKDGYLSKENEKSRIIIREKTNLQYNKIFKLNKGHENYAIKLINLGEASLSIPEIEDKSIDGKNIIIYAEKLNNSLSKLQGTITTMKASLTLHTEKNKKSINELEEFNNFLESHTVELEFINKQFNSLITSYRNHKEKEKRKLDEELRIIEFNNSLNNSKTLIERSKKLTTSCRNAFSLHNWPQDPCDLLLLNLDNSLSTLISMLERNTEGSKRFIEALNKINQQIETILNEKAQFFTYITAYSEFCTCIAKVSDDVIFLKHVDEYNRCLSSSLIIKFINTLILDGKNRIDLFLKLLFNIHDSNSSEESLSDLEPILLLMTLLDTLIIIMKLLVKEENKLYMSKQLIQDSLKEETNHVEIFEFFEYYKSDTIDSLLYKLGNIEGIMRKITDKYVSLIINDINYINNSNDHCNIMLNIQAAIDSDIIIRVKSCCRQISESVSYFHNEKSKILLNIEDKERKIQEDKLNKRNLILDRLEKMKKEEQDKKIIKQPIKRTREKYDNRDLDRYDNRDIDRYDNRDRDRYRYDSKDRHRDRYDTRDKRDYKDRRRSRSRSPPVSNRRSRSRSISNDYYRSNGDRYGSRDSGRARYRSRSNSASDNDNDSDNDDNSDNDNDTNEVKEASIREKLISIKKAKSLINERTIN